LVLAALKMNSAVSKTIKAIALNLHSVIVFQTQITFASNALPPLELLRPLAKLDTIFMQTPTLGSAPQWVRWLDNAPKNLAQKNSSVHNNKNVTATPRYA
jgi:hypothetical protein